MCIALAIWQLRATQKIRVWPKQISFLYQLGSSFSAIIVSWESSSPRALIRWPRYWEPSHGTPSQIQKCNGNVFLRIFEQFEYPWLCFWVFRKDEIVFKFRLFMINSIFFTQHTHTQNLKCFKSCAVKTMIHICREHIIAGWWIRMDFLLAHHLNNKLNYINPSLRYEIRNKEINNVSKKKKRATRLTCPRNYKSNYIFIFYISIDRSGEFEPWMSPLQSTSWAIWLLVEHKVPWL